MEVVSMLKLIKLEMKKVKMGGYIRGALIANLVIIAAIIIILIGSKSEGEVAFENYDFAFMIMGSLVKGTFIVFASVMLSRFIIEEYKTGTITLLFMYPINRKKLLLAKLIIVSVFTFVSTFLTNIFIDLVLILINNIYEFIPDNLTIEMLVYNFISISMGSLAATCMALIPLYFGMKKKSAPVTILSSLLIVTIVCSNINGFSLGAIIAVPITLAVIGVLIGYLAIRNVEHIDVNT
jgi:ABC-type transport system involved in multi-copper enzyme maturation permease subunit